MSMPDAGAVEAIVQGRHGDPFAVLGPHDSAGGCSIRAFLPGASGAAVIDRVGGQVLGTLQRLHPDGFWAGTIPERVSYDLRFDTLLGPYRTADAYAFPPTLGPLDLHLLGEGRHRELGHVLGAHPAEMDGVAGVRFAVWAPNASRVSVVGDFNFWDGRRHPMRRHVGAGVWDLFVPGIGAGGLQVRAAWPGRRDAAAKG